MITPFLRKLSCFGCLTNVIKTLVNILLLKINALLSWIIANLPKIKGWVCLSVSIQIRLIGSTNGFAIIYLFP